VFSRRSPHSVQQSLASLQAEYLVLSAPWCLTTQRGGCALTEVWDIEEPELAGGKPVCPVLWHSPPHPFKKIFQNQEYVLLKVSDVLEIPQSFTKDM